MLYLSVKLSLSLSLQNATTDLGGGVKTRVSHAVSEGGGQSGNGGDGCGHSHIKDNGRVQGVGGLNGV